LEDININLNKIKRLKIEMDNIDSQPNFSKVFQVELSPGVGMGTIPFKSVPGGVLSEDIIRKNLLFCFNINNNYVIKNHDLFEYINNFKSLRFLYIENVNFKKDFIIKLKKLKVLSIKSCRNIQLSGINDNLKELYLSNDEISDMNLLKKMNCRELNILDLSNNKISDIYFLEKVNFKELNLCHNKISDINVLEKVNFKELKELNLSYNEISDISILEKVNFKELKKLDLRSNQILKN